MIARLILEKYRRRAVAIKPPFDGMEWEYAETEKTLAELRENAPKDLKTHNEQGFTEDFVNGFNMANNEWRRFLI